MSTPFCVSTTSSKQIEMSVSGKLFWCLTLNIAITFLQIAGALWTGSIALFSDALHNFSDVMSLGISYIAEILFQRDANLQQTFGYQRIRVLAGFVNSATLVCICIFLIFQGIERLINPKTIQAEIVMFCAFAGIIVNFCSAIILKQTTKNNLNMAASYLNLIADAIVSCAIFIGATCMLLFGMYRLDSLICIFGAIFLASKGYKIVKKSYSILMGFTPNNIDLLEIQKKALCVEGVQHIQHLHAWEMSENNIHFEAQVVLANNPSLIQIQSILKKLKKMLHKQFGIEHSFLELTDNPNLKISSTKN